jgi:hypothetical protein
MFSIFKGYITYFSIFYVGLLFRPKDLVSLIVDCFWGYILSIEGFTF